MLSRRTLIASVLGNASGELAYNIIDDEFIYDGLLITAARSIALLKSVEKDKTYYLTYNYRFEPIEVANTGNNNFGVKYAEAFGYGYSFKLNFGSGVMPTNPVYTGTFKKVIICSNTCTNTELIKITASLCKYKARIWDVSLTKV